MYEMSDEERRMEEQRLADERLAQDGALEQEQGLEEEQAELAPDVERGDEQLQLPVEGEPNFIPPLPPTEAHRPVEPVEIDPAAMPGTDEAGNPVDENGDPLPEPEVVVEEPLVEE